MINWRIGLAGLVGLTVIACSGGGGSGGGAPTPLPSSDPWESVETEIEAFVVQDVAVLVGDKTGPLYVYERGNVTIDTSLRSASAAKLLTGLTLITLVEDGALSLQTGPADVLSFWTADDLRSAVTLAQLLSFTSGFNAAPLDLGCWLNGALSLQTCAQRIYNNGLDTAPGEAFAYGPEHMQVAGAMAESISGLSFADLFRRQIADPLNLTPSFAFELPSTTNPRLSAGAIVNARDYGMLLQAVLAGDVVTDGDAFLKDFTAGVRVDSAPAGLDGLDWHYGLGFWLECDEAVFTIACETSPTISSPGAYGFTPWIDFDTGYWGVIAMEEPLVNGQRGAQIAVALEQALQPLIEVALDRIR